MKRLIASAVTIAALAVPGAAGATTFWYSAAADAYVSSAHPTRNYGSGPTLRVDNDAAAIQKAWLKFDLGSDVYSFPRSLYVVVWQNNVSKNRFLLFRDVTSAWTESSITWSSVAQTGGVLAGQSDFDTEQRRRVPWCDNALAATTSVPRCPATVSGTIAVRLEHAATGTTQLAFESREGKLGQAFYHPPQLGVTPR